MMAKGGIFVDNEDRFSARVWQSEKGQGLKGNRLTKHIFGTFCYARTMRIVRAYSNVSLSVLRASSKSLHLISVI